MYKVNIHVGKVYCIMTTTDNLVIAVGMKINDTLI